MRRDPAGDACGEAAESEGKRLVAIKIDAIGLRGDLVLPYGPQRAAEMRVEEPRLQGGDRDEHQETGPVNPAIAVDIAAEKGTREECR